MADPVAGPAITTDPPGLPHASLRRVTAVLCTTEIVSWGVLYYAFPVLATSIAADTGWPTTWVVLGFTGSQLAAGAAGVLVGRHLHGHGPRAVMTGGSVLGVLAVLGVATAPTLPLFLAAWLLVGVAMAATLYPPAFAALTGWGGARRLQALTALTLVAGFASTVFAPLSAFLEAQAGWRGTYLVLAGVLLVTVPLHWWGLNHPWRELSGTAEPSGQTDVPPGTPIWRTVPFLALVAASALVGLCMWSGVVLFVPLFAEHGFGTQEAAIALGLGGVGQVCGRLGYRWLHEHTSVAARTQLVFGWVAVTTLALALVSDPYLVLVLLAMLAGAGRGVFTLIQATAVADRWGIGEYARLNGIAAMPLMLTGALAPWIGFAVAQQAGSYAATMVLMALAAGLGTVLVRSTLVPIPAFRLRATPGGP